MNEPTAVKEGTILSLSNDLRDATQATRSMLDDYFDCIPTAEESEGAHPAQPNVLQDIIEILVGALTQERDNQDFIQKRILDKIR